MLKKWFCCYLMRSHDWTSLAIENPKQVPRGYHPERGDSADEIMRKFKAYGRMYCKRCDKTSKLSV